ncbi:MAG: YihA family ribosome biogenesis GTP-binding protein [Clostridia bacterium]|nr:YihA family ribosome biogenesis GTP-binding protein [Clostridia bacterium]
MELNFRIKQAEFVTSVGLGQGYPAPLGAEIAIVGKSNVGKSSLINRLCGNSKLARTSSQPGKTRLINFFSINRGQFYLVDLPGYGYAKASKAEQQKWSELIESYLASGRVDHLFLLIDIRHEPTQNDRQMLQYLLYYNIPYTLIATKSDKIVKSRRQVQANANARLLGAPAYAIPFSGETGEGRDALLLTIGALLSERSDEKRDENSVKNEN